MCVVWPGVGRIKWCATIGTCCCLGSAIRFPHLVLRVDDWNLQEQHLELLIAGETWHDLGSKIEIRVDAA